MQHDLSQIGHRRGVLIIVQPESQLGLTNGAPCTAPVRREHAILRTASSRRTHCFSPKSWLRGRNSAPRRLFQEGYGFLSLVQSTIVQRRPSPAISVASNG